MQHAFNRTLICIVAYEAENHIQRVLERLPAIIWNSPEYHVLLSDDASRDRTVDVASNILNTLGNNYSILKLVNNQGYGGNQKVCYRFAIENNFDIVVLLHGDGQYAPELVVEFVRFIKDQQTDVVLGSRMMKLHSAIQGKMPYYKLVGNLILTKIQNYLCHTNLSEFHTGYRAYTVKFLKHIPFELNSDKFHFDTEILLQAFHANARIYEFLIPTHYGNEICRVPGLQYAWNVIISCLKFRLQKLGLLTSLKYPYSANQAYQNYPQDPNSVHSILFHYLKENNYLERKKILDIGCGTGDLANKMLNHSAAITGVDLHTPVFPAFQKFIQMNLEADPWLIDITEFNIVLLLDTLEYLISPEQFLLSLRYHMTQLSTPKVIISVPNIGFILMRINLLLGRFNYSDRGIVNIKHKRFFTLKTLKETLAETGYEVQLIRGIGLPIQTFGKGPLFKILSWLSALLARWYISLFAFQILVVTQPKLTVYQLIEFGRVTKE